MKLHASVQILPRDIISKYHKEQYRYHPPAHRSVLDNVCMLQEDRRKRIIELLREPSFPVQQCAYRQGTV